MQRETLLDAFIVLSKRPQNAPPGAHMDPLSWLSNHTEEATEILHSVINERGEFGNLPRQLCARDIYESQSVSPHG